MLTVDNFDNKEELNSSSYSTYQNHLKDDKQCLQCYAALAKHIPLTKTILIHSTITPQFIWEYNKILTVSSKCR